MGFWINPAGKGPTGSESTGLLVAVVKKWMFAASKSQKACIVTGKSETKIFQICMFPFSELGCSPVNKKVNSEESGSDIPNLMHTLLSWHKIHTWHNIG